MKFLGFCLGGGLVALLWLLVNIKTEAQRECWHHQDGTSFLASSLIESGARKMWRCHKCYKVWFS